MVEIAQVGVFYSLHVHQLSPASRTSTPFLFKPRLPFMSKPKQAAPFFGLNDKMPILLALLLGFQHALAMLAVRRVPEHSLSSSHTDRGRDGRGGMSSRDAAW